ncbi:MAG TPA: AraC family transcriptional regulator [Armatimonadota bacterium]|jgi:AraC-like DNA-binding protein
MPITPVTLISVGHVRPNPRWGMPPHQHSFHEMIAVVRGHLHVTFPEGTVHAGPDDVLFYAAGVPHEEHADPREALETVFVSLQWEGATAGIPRFQHDAARRISPLIRWLFEERFTSGATMASLRQSCAQTILAAYLHLAAYQEPGMVEQVRHYMRAHLAEAITTEELAACAGVSKFHFIRTYRRLSGHTPMDDVRRLRVEAARDLLLSTDAPLKTIAVQVGMANAYHLSRLVRHYLGMPPSAVRKRVSWGAPPPLIEEY